MMLLDMPGAIVTALRDDDEVMTAFDGKVFSDVVPADTDPAFVVVRNNGADQLLWGVQSWDEVSVLADIVGDPENVPNLTLLAGMVRAAFEGLSGTVTNGVAIQSVSPTTLVFGYDPTFTPPLPRWVLATSLVVRDNTKE